jgi:hypothetical protein
MDEWTDRLVILRGGLVVPIEPFLLLVRLEARGFRFRLAADGTPEVGPFDRLSATDLTALRRWRAHMALLISYTADDTHLFTDAAAAMSKADAAYHDPRDALKMMRSSDSSVAA